MASLTKAVAAVRVARRESCLEKDKEEEKEKEGEDGGKEAHGTNVFCHVLSGRTLSLCKSPPQCRLRVCLLRFLPSCRCLWLRVISPRELGS